MARQVALGGSDERRRRLATGRQAALALWVAAALLGSLPSTAEAASPRPWSLATSSMPSVSIDDVSAVEGNSATKSLIFTVTLSSASGTTTLIPFTTADGLATAPSDYVATAGTLTIRAGAASGKIRVALKGDAVIEPDETFFVNLGTPTNATIAKGQGIGTILNDDHPGTFSFSAASYTISERAAFATIRVTRANGKGAGATVDYAVTPGSATLGSDYDLPPTSTLTFAANQLSGVFTVPIVRDTIHEPTETILLGLSNPQPAASGAALGNPGSAVLNIVDNDSAGKVQLLYTAYSVNAAAAATSVKLTVKRIGGLASGVTVHCTMVGGTATGGVDFDNTPQDLTFLSSGIGATTQSLTIPISQNASEAKNFTVILNPPSGGAVLGTLTAATVTILGAEPTLGFSSGAYTVKTIQGTAVVTVKRSAPLTGTVKVNYATSPGPGTNVGGPDYTDVAGTLTFAPHVSVGRFAVPIVKDPLVDPDETVNLMLSSPTWSLGTAAVDPVLGTSLLTITNPNTTPTIQFSAATYTVGEAGLKALISARRTGDRVGTVTVDYAATGGTATNGGVDYTLSPGTLTFLPNQVTRTFSIPIVNDTLVEGTETVQLHLSNATWSGGTAVVGPLGTATLDILDNEPTVRFTAANYSVKEGTKAALIGVKRTGSLAGIATVTYDVTGGSAVRDTGSGGDYSLTAPGSLTFAPGESVKTIRITFEPDTIPEGIMTIDLALSGPSGAGLGTPSTTTVAIKDKVPPPPLPAGLIDTVYLITLENTDWSSATNQVDYIKNNPALPYINSLIQDYAAADDFHAPFHPSMPNYLALETGGDNLGRTSSSMPFKYTANVAVTDGCLEPFAGAPTDGSVNCRNGLYRAPLGAPHLSKSLNTARFTWKQYNGDPPGNGTLCPNVNRFADTYSADHSPNLYFDDVTGSDPLLLTLQPGSPLLAYCIAHLRPLAELVGDLQHGRESNYNFIIATDQDQGEKCPCGAGGRLGNADRFMQKIIPDIMTNSPAWGRGTAVIFVAWDEPDNSNNTDPSGLIVISPSVKKGYLSQTKFPNGEASLVKTVLEIFGLPLFGKTTDPANPDLSEFFTIFP